MPEFLTPLSAPSMRMTEENDEPAPFLRRRSSINPFQFLLSMAQTNKPNVAIDFDDGPDQGCPRSYTTWDTITGKVALTAPRDTRFESIEVSLDGMLVSFLTSSVP